MLEDFCRFLNEEVGGHGKLELPTDWDYGTAMQKSLERHYAEDRQKDGLRISGMGKPAVVQALMKLGYGEPEPRGKMRFIFHFGDMYELWLGVMLRVYGFEVLGDQMEDEATFITSRGIGGHYDYLIGEGDDKLLLEVKTMSEGYARNFKKDPNDERGYLTQLAMYWDGLGKEVPAAWLCFNKGTNEAFYVEPHIDAMEGALQRVDRVLPRLKALTHEDEVLEVFQAPPPELEKYRRSETGAYVLPGSMKWSPFAPAFYHLEEHPNKYGRTVKYVVGMKNTDEMKTEIDRLLGTGVIVRGNPS